MTRRLLVLAVLLAGLAAVPVVLAKASHEGWPKIDYFEKNEADRDRTMKGTPRSDELLGGHGDDRIEGLADDDVIWGDYKPTNQTTKQRDRLFGGEGDDFLYPSHGRNIVKGGVGSDVIHGRFGHGAIDCGPGRDALYLPRRRGAYKLRNCEWKRLKTGDSAPKWWLRTHPTGR